jgi:hypothetical protein
MKRKEGKERKGNFLMVPRNYMMCRFYNPGAQVLKRYLKHGHYNGNFYMVSAGPFQVPDKNV